MYKCSATVNIDKDINKLLSLINKVQNEIVNFDDWDINLNIYNLNSVDKVCFEFYVSDKELYINSKEGNDSMTLDDVIGRINRYNEDINAKIYVFNIEEVGNLKDKILEDKLAIILDESSLLAKSSELNVDNNIIKSCYTLEEFIKEKYINNSLGVKVIDGLTITMKEVVNTFVNELYDYSVSESTYAMEIYNSKEPSREILKLINQFIYVAIENKVEEIDERKYEISDNIENGEFVWK
jgi:hypothetical protein